MAELFVLIHAPALGPASWAPVADELARRGHHVLVPSLAGLAANGPPYTPHLLERARAQLPGRTADNAVLVVHSGAGVFAPYLADGLAGGEAAVIFADAGLPADDGPGRVIEEEFLPFVRDMADGGLVPPWPRWWPAAELDPLFPDQATRERVSSEAAALPLAFFEEVLPPRPAGWPPRRCGYLQFSEGYQEPARRAAARGWPVRKLPGGHLHMLIAPAAVAGAISSLTGSLRAA